MEISSYQLNATLLASTMTVQRSGHAPRHAYRKRRFEKCTKTPHEPSRTDEDDAFLRQFFFSKSWRASFCHDRILMYADDYDLFEHSRRFALDRDFATLFADTEDHILESIAAWCGGWSAFVKARKYGASPAETPSLVGDAVCLGDMHGKQTLCKPVIIIDIHCDDEWKWTAFHPITNNDLKNQDDDGKWGLPLYSTKTLGDKTDIATAAVTPDVFELESVPDEDEDELDELLYDPLPSQYLLTTDAADTREYTISVSIVSPTFAETLISIMSIVPEEEIQNPKATWAGPINQDSNFPFPSSLRRYQPPRSRSKINLSYLHKGKFCTGPRPYFDVGFYRDERHDSPRFHVMFERMVFPKSAPKILVNRPAADALTTMASLNK